MLECIQWYPMVAKIGSAADDNKKHAQTEDYLQENGCSIAVFLFHHSTYTKNNQTADKHSTRKTAVIYKKDKWRQHNECDA